MSPPLFLRAKAVFARFLSALPWLVPVALLLDMLAGMMIPIYSDEIGWRLQERAGLDGVDKLYSNKCGPSSLATPAIFMWPVRWYSAWFNAALPDPIWVRLSGVAYALVFAGLLVTLARRIASNTEQRRWLPLVACAMLGLGLLPWLLVWSRPEQPVLLALTATLLLAWPAGRITSSHSNRSGHWPWRPFAMAALWAISLSYHFKTLALLPIYLLAIALSPHSKPRRGPRVLAGLAVVALAVAGGHYWFLRLGCPGDPEIAAQFAGQNLGAQLLLGQGWGHAIMALAKNFLLPVYVVLTAPAAKPMDDWLVADQISDTGQAIWAAGLMLFWLAGLALAAMRLFPVLATFARHRRIAPDLVPGTLMALACFGCASAYCVSQVVRNDYEAGFVLPLLLLSCLFALGLPDAAAAQDHTPAREHLAIYARTTGVAMLLSVAGIGMLYGPSLWQAFGQSGYLPAQPNSVAVRGYAPWRQRILATARLCGIAPDDTHPRLLLDSATYFAMMRAPLPDHKTSVLDPRYNGEDKDAMRYLAANRSSGAVLGCQWLSGPLRARARTADGQICCLAPADFAPHAKSR